LYKIDTSDVYFELLNNFSFYKGSNPTGLINDGNNLYGMTVNGAN
jgi:hypothetical protein